MKREDPRDVFLPRPGVAVKLASQLPAGSVIATGSLRRSAQVMGWKRGIKVADLRGNLQTRWQRLVESNWAGIILARAGVARLGWLERIGEVLDVNEMMPAVGQGSLAVEVRSDDNEAVELVACLEHDASRYAAEAERAWLRVLEGGCRVPVGALAQISNNRLTLSGLATSLDGTQVIRAKAAGDPDEAGEIGRRLAEVFLSSGADSILSNARAAQPAGLTL
jgi:hydroxymethylbilane synthase